MYFKSKLADFATDLRHFRNKIQTLQIYCAFFTSTLKYKKYTISLQCVHNIYYHAADLKPAIFLHILWGFFPQDTDEICCYCHMLPTFCRLICSLPAAWTYRNTLMNGAFMYRKKLYESIFFLSYYHDGIRIEVGQMYQTWCKGSIKQSSMTTN